MPITIDFLHSLNQRKRIDNVLVYLNKAYDDYVDLSQLSEIACYSPFHFQRLFSEFIGETWSVYIRRNRLLIAAQRLSSTTEKIYDISTLAGFSTQTGFLKAFKNYFGYNPKQYRSLYSGEKFLSHIPTKSTGKYSSLKPVLVNLEPATLLIERGGGIVNGHFDQVAWNASTRLLRHIYQDKELHKFFPSFVCYVDRFDELFKRSYAEFNVALAIDDTFYRPNASYEYVKIGGGLYAELVHSGSMYEHSLNKLVFEWLPQSGFELDNNRHMFFLPRSMPAELYKFFGSHNPKRSQLIYEASSLSREQIEAYHTRILIPLIEKSICDTIWKKLEARHLLIPNCQSCSRKNIQAVNLDVLLNPS